MPKTLCKDVGHHTNSHHWITQPALVISIVQQPDPSSLSLAPQGLTKTHGNPEILKQILCMDNILTLSLLKNRDSGRFTSTKSP